MFECELYNEILGKLIGNIQNKQKRTYQKARHVI